MMNESTEHNQTQTCPQCDNHCPIDALKCGRGRKYFGIADGGLDHAHDDSRSHDDGHGYHSGRGGGHHKHGGRGR